MKNRDSYLKKLIDYKDKPMIKVITGIRRCGKSTLLSLYERYLLNHGVEPQNIIRINFESFEFEHITNYRELHAFIKSKMTKSSSRFYILLDEVQLIESWEKVVNSFLVDADVDIYLTGSNAYLLSSELATLLSGRYVEVKMLPLSFKEFLDFTKDQNFTDEKYAFNQYLTFGGLPTVVDLLDRPDTIPDYLEGIYNTVLLKDVVDRNNIRDTALLESVLRYIAANVGNIVSTKKISDYLTSSGRKVTSETIDNYLRMLENAFIIYKANRYDLKGKLYLKTLEKYYMVDSGIRNKITGSRNMDVGYVLENIIYVELLRRGYQVAIGKIGTLEVDFVATKSNEKIYYQISASILDSDTRERELRPLQAISDNYPKIIITMDDLPFDDYDGVKVVNILKFLIENE